jgi:type II secretory pathway component PulF
MPLPTAVLMGVSRWLSAYWWVAALLMTGIAVGVWQWSQTRAGRSAIHRAAVRLPVISKVVRAFCVARIARVLGMLLTSRVPLNEALRLAHDVAGNEQFGLALAAAEETVTRGGSLSTALADSKLFAPTVCEAVRSGEQAGRLGDLLMLVADYLDEENATTLKAATAMVEPAILIVVGVIVGGIVLSIFLPLFDVAASAGGGS